MICCGGWAMVKSLLMRGSDLKEHYGLDNRQLAELISELRPVGQWGKDSLYSEAEASKRIKAGAGK